jgi:sulfite exporter TauE/SafE
VIGLLTGALPCGWLYGFAVTAAGTGSALAGALLMIVFWAGTLPVMVGLGVGVQALAAPLRRHLPTACALAMIAVGVLAVSGRVRAPIEIPPVQHGTASRDATAPAPHHHGRH